MVFVERGIATIQLFVIRLGLRPRLAFAPLDRLLENLRVSSRRRATSLSLHELESAIDRAEGVVDRLPGVGCSCLYRSLGRFGLLSAWGYRPEFVMGVARADPEQAHAWLELDGAPFREERAADFAESFRFPAAAARRC